MARGLVPPEGALLVSAYVLLGILCFGSPANGLNQRKLDETAVPSTTNPPGEEKCSPACVTPSPPPPPPPAPCPPPPELPPPPPPPPPPSPKKPPSGYCPPPPPSPYIYVTGPPGQLYPIDSDYNAAGPVPSSTSFSLLAGFLSLSLLAFWGSFSGLNQ